jgi:hypothetical protein
MSHAGCEPVSKACCMARVCAAHCSVMSVLRGAVLESRDYAVSGTGATYIVGFMDSQYPSGGAPRGLTREECLEVVRGALALALERDSQSGGGVTVCCVDVNGVSKGRLSPHALRTPGAAGQVLVERGRRRDCASPPEGLRKEE